jgi:hypothetical protein
MMKIRRGLNHDRESKAPHKGAAKAAPIALVTVIAQHKAALAATEAVYTHSRHNENWGRKSGASAVTTIAKGARQT